MQFKTLYLMIYNTYVYIISILLILHIEMFITVVTVSQLLSYHR